MQVLEGSSVPTGKGAAPPLRVLMPSPIGMLGVELTGTAVSRLRIDPGEPERSQFTPLQQIDGSDFLDEVFGRLSEYFAGARRKLDLAFDLGPCGVNGLARRVLRETAKIPYGRTRTCQALAEAMGSPDGGPHVLAVLRENPIPILIPCHRVLEGRSEVGFYIGGTERKRWLLDLERRDEESWL
jgi:methylated-DNA-[protein]-cysteine S-methyltransferase